MEWNVYYHEINLDEIKTFNIFDHYYFVIDVQKAISKVENKEDFESKLKSELFYYYGSKAEWEVIITSWCGGNRERNSIKIDVYNQIMMNWNIFVDYCWEHRKELLKLGD